MSSKIRREPKLESQKIGRRIEPEHLAERALERPLGDISLATVQEESPLPETSFLTHRSDGSSSVGEAIRMLRKEKGVSQEELARKAHIDRTTIARLECGIFKSLSMEHLNGIAGAIGIDLKTLLLKAESMGESLSYRGHLNEITFALEYPAEGFRIMSLTPKRKEFFFGKIEIQPQRTIPFDKLPHPEQVYLHCLEGKVLLLREAREFLLRPGDCFAFSGLSEYELYNSDQFKVASTLYITYPSFVSM